MLLFLNKWGVRNVWLSLGFLLIFLSARGQSFNRPVPNGFPQYEFQSNDTTLNKYFLLTPNLNLGPSPSKSIYLLDAKGYIVWASSQDRKIFDFKFNPSLNNYSYTRQSNGIIKHYLMDASFDLVDSIAVPAQYGGDIHEFTALPNGNIMVLAMEWVEMDLSSYTIFGNPGDSNTIVNTPHVLEYDNSLNLIWDWRAIDHLPVDYYVQQYGYNVNDFDYLHANAIEKDDQGDVLVSLRNGDCVVKIDYATQSTDWVLGGNFNQFAFTNDGGFNGQHDIRYLGNNKISLFDNQNHSGTFESRGVVYQLDTVNMTATLVDSYHETPAQFSKTKGNFRLLDDGYQIIGWGGCNRPGPSITLADSLDNVTAHVFLEDTMVTYRAYYQDIALLPQRPTISCEEIAGGLKLTASTANQYEWSTGEGTQEITVFSPDTIVVWVNQGIGLLGSEPYYIADINQCGSVGITTLDLEINETIIGYCDLLGKPLKFAPKGVLFLIRYSSGRVEKHFGY